MWLLREFVYLDVRLMGESVVVFQASHSTKSGTVNEVFSFPGKCGILQMLKKQPEFIDHNWIPS